MIANIKNWLYGFAQFIVVLLLCVAVIAPMYCGRIGKLQPKGVTKVVTYTNTVDSTPIQPKVVPITLVDSIPYPVNTPINVDTAAIIAQYLTTFVYNRTVRDSNLVLDITDTINQGKIKGYKIEYKIIKPCISTHTENTVQASPKQKLFMGIGSGIGTAQLNASLLYISKKQQGLSISNNIIGTQPNIQLTAYFKIY